MGRRALIALCEAGVPPALILTYSDQLAHRSGFASLTSIADKHEIPCVATSDINSAEVLDAVRSCGADLLVVAGWSQIVRHEMLSRFRLGAVGLHPTLLPEGRGRAPIPWTIIKGLRETGATLFRLEASVDSGDIVAQERYSVNRRDDAGTVYEKMAEVSVKLLLDNLPPLLEGTAGATPQVDVGTIWPRRRPSEGGIAWDELDAERIYDWVRALTTPYPGAFTHLRDGRRIVVWQADFLDGITVPAAPGEVVGEMWSTRQGGIAVAARGGGVVILTLVQLGDGDVIDGLALAERGLATKGDRLG